jgi:hypothetical protein
MATLRSSWATSPIALNGILSGPEWAGAGVMPIPAGLMMAKNDNQFLYIALDLVGDRGSDAGVGDYFWFSVDTNGSRSITPNVDVNYGIWPMLPIRIARQFFLGPGTWTGILGTPSTAVVRQGFGASPHSATPHRIWEMRLPLTEIGVASLGGMVDPALHFGLRVASSNPGFVYDYPANFYNSFANLHNLLLARTATLPAGMLGPVIGTIGLIPATAPQLVGGYATTAAGYYVPADEAAFGGTLHVIGNRTALQALWAAGARKYRVLWRAGSAAAFAPLLQSWQNYRLTGTTYTLESHTWDSQQMYTLPDPAQDYSIDDLLMQWNTVGAVGLHELQVAFYRDDPARTPVASPPQTVGLMIDNNLPLVKINQILHNDVPVSACAMETMTDAADGVRASITVNDLEGHLKDLALTAHWGAGASATVFSDGYPAHRAATHHWSGVSALKVPAGEWVPPVTCAYQFRLSATPRVTNGYVYIGYVEDTFHVTLIKPASAAPFAARSLDARLPFGQLAAGVPPAAGTEPDKLGG